MEEKLVTVLAIIGGVVGIFILIGVLALLMAYPTMWAWNYVMPYLFGLKTLSFWQAFSINFLANMLFKSSNTNNCKK